MKRAKLTTMDGRPALGLLAVAVLSAGLVACDGLGGLLISNARELEIGQSVDLEIEKTYRIVDSSSPVAQWAVQLVAPLQAASVDFRDPGEFAGYKVEVIDDPQLLNAFAAPGGFTYLSTGLILEATSCGEIAGVMGHELAHVTSRHSVEQMESSFLGAGIAEILFGDSLLGDIAGTLWGFIQGTTFSRDHEAESDEVGLQVAFNAGYNPYGLVDFFDHLVQLEQASGGISIPEFLSSHPASEDRVRDVSASIERRYGGAVQRGTTQTYSCVGTALQLHDIQAMILAGNLPVKRGTGTAP